MWSVFVYYDFGDFQCCDRREYVFEREDMAESFRLQAVELHGMVYVSPIICNHHSSSLQTCFQTISKALEDVVQFVDREQRSQYRHRDKIDSISMDHLQFLIYRSECMYLEEENKLLRSKLEMYEKHANS